MSEATAFHNVTGSRATRASRPKVRTGCSICKKRRVKCDEGKPSCLRCSKAGIICAGYGIRIPTRTDRFLLPADRERGGYDAQLDIRNPDAANSLTSNDAVIFDFCRYQTLVDLGFSQDRFWTKTVLSACHEEPAILQATLALGTAHRKFLDGQSALSSNLVTYEHYASAVAHLQQTCTSGSRDQLKVILIVCIMLVCADLALQRYVPAGIHLIHGRRILQMLVGKGGTAPLYLAPASESVEDELVFCLAQLDLQFTSFGGKRPQLDLTTTQDVAAGESSVPLAFTSIGDAARYLMIINNESSKFRGITPDPAVLNIFNGDAVATQASLLKRLQAWKTAFDRSSFNIETGARTDIITERKLLSLGIQHAVLSSSVASCITHGEELQYDTHLEYFTTIIRNAARILPHLPTFKLDSVVIQPLYVVTMRCRHPILRRRALQHISQTRREGLWDSRLVLAMATEIMKFEETESGFVYNDSDTFPESANIGSIIPAESRISEMWALFPKEDMSLLRIIMRRRVAQSKVTIQSDLVDAKLAPEGNWEEIERLVPWDST